MWHTHGESHYAPDDMLRLQDLMSRSCQYPAIPLSFASGTVLECHVADQPATLALDTFRQVETHNMLAKACEATFSLVRTMMESMIDSDQPSNNGSCSSLSCTKDFTEWTICLTRDKMRDASVAGKWPSLFCTRGNRETFCFIGRLSANSTSHISRIAALYRPALS